MNLEKAIETIRFDISEPDPDNSRWTQTQIINVINRAIKDVATKVKYPTRISEISSVAKTQDYALASGTVEVITVTYDGKLLEPIEYREGKLKEQTTTGTIIYRTPRNYYLTEDLKLWLVPIPDKSDKIIKIYNSYIPDDLSELTDSLPYDIDSYNELIIFLALQKLLSADFPEKAVYWKNLFDEKRTEIELDIKERQGPEYINYTDFY